MILTKNEIAIAQELARDLVEVNKHKERKQKTMQSLNNIVRGVRNVLLELWERIKNLFNVIPIPRMMNIRSDL